MYVQFPPKPCSPVTPVVFRDGRFNRQYDPRDTRMLLDALAVDYDPEAVRIEQVHRQAMSLLTVDE